ncbi:MAG: sigma-70 family RNA polymerase sigma factor [Defluviitaleaceae bacterium]|nr:sigma-70 family RNA polymerase sigma factor [Defluviitaleaceae bacterium]
MVGFTIINAMDNDADKSKIARIFDEYYYLMLHIAMEVLKDRDLAEDAVSESVEKLIKNISNIGEVSCYKTKSYIVIIVKNTSINLLKKMCLSENHFDETAEVVDPDSPIPEKLVSMEGYENLVDIIKSLPPALKDAAILSLVHDRSHSEIAEELGISYDAVKMRLSRAKQVIRNALGGGHPVE